MVVQSHSEKVTHVGLKGKINLVPKVLNKGKYW